MILFSRSFIRKRAISLATTASFGAISFALAQDPTRTNHFGAAMPVQYVTDRSLVSEEQPLLSESGTIARRMMTEMMIKPTGNVDRDFVAMMEPHHQGAMNLAKTELKYGKRLRRLAREIVAIRDVVRDGRSSTGQPRAELSPQAGLTDRSVTPGG